LFFLPGKKLLTINAETILRHFDLMMNGHLSSA
jgi:hypothetical protein